MFRKEKEVEEQSGFSLVTRRKKQRIKKSSMFAMIDDLYPSIEDKGNLLHKYIKDIKKINNSDRHAYIFNHHARLDESSLKELERIFSKLLTFEEYHSTVDEVFSAKSQKILEFAK